MVARHNAAAQPKTKTHDMAPSMCTYTPQRSPSMTCGRAAIHKSIPCRNLKPNSQTQDSRSTALGGAFKPPRAAESASAFAKPAGRGCNGMVNVNRGFSTTASTCKLPPELWRAHLVRTKQLFHLPTRLNALHAFLSAGIASVTKCTREMDFEHRSAIPYFPRPTQMHIATEVNLFKRLLRLARREHCACGARLSEEFAPFIQLMNARCMIATQRLPDEPGLACVMHLYAILQCT